MRAVMTMPPDTAPGIRGRVLMLLENNSFARDRRVRLEAAALREDGWDVTVIAPRAADETGWTQSHEGVRVYGYPAPPPGEGALGYAWEYFYSMVMACLLTLRAAFGPGFDVVHAHNPPDLYFLIGAVGRLFGRKFVYDHHDLAPELYLDKFGGGRGAVFTVLNTLRGLSCRVAHRVLVVNESCRRACVEESGADDERIVTIRNGPDDARFRRTKADPELRSLAPKLVGYVGIMGSQDGVDHLIDAMHTIKHDHGRHDIHCLLVGTGDELEQLRARADRLEVSDQLHFLGWISDDQRLMQVLSSVDVCVVPDPSNPLTDKCTMIKVMEYMCLGQPIVAFDLPETRTSAGDAAVYAGKNDAKRLAQEILAVLDDPDRAARMGQLGLSRIQDQFAWRYSAERLQLLYRSFGRSLRSPSA